MSTINVAQAPSDLTAKTMKPVLPTALIVSLLGFIPGCLNKPDAEQAAIDIDLRRYVVDLGDQKADYALGGCSRTVRPRARSALPESASIPVSTLARSPFA